MPDIIRAIIVLAVLLLFVLLPNIVIVKPHRVHIVERLGTYHRSLDQKGVYWTIPIIERVIQIVPMDIQKRQIFINPKDKNGLSITYTYQVIDVMRFVYQALDTKKEIDDILRSHVTVNQPLESYDLSSIEDTLDALGVKVIEIKVDN